MIGIPMDEQPADIPQGAIKNPVRTEWLTVGQFALSALALFVLWSSALGLAFYGVISFIGGSSLQSPLSLTLVAAGAGASGLLVLPSAFYAFMRIIGRPVGKIKINLNFLRPTIWIFILPVVLLAGFFVSRLPRIAWVALPPLHVIAIGLPVSWLLYLGVRRLPLGSPQRAWGVFGSGLVLGPALILVTEMTALVLFGLLALAVIASQPDMLAQLQSLVDHLRMPGASPDLVLPFIQPFLTRPLVILAVLSFGSVVVPLVEEFFKPIGVWLLVGKNLSPAAGFAAGALSGAGYALFESLALSSSGEGWAFLVVARIGTAVIHILTTALTGWALSQSWRDGRYLRLAAAYLTAVLIHGFWNGLTLISSYNSLMSLQPSQAGFSLIARIGAAAPLGLIVLTLGALALLLWFNQVLYQSNEIKSSTGPDEKPMQATEQA